MICSICKKGETSVVDSRPTEDGIRDVERSRGLGDVYKRQHVILALHKLSDAKFPFTLNGLRSTNIK